MSGDFYKKGVKMNYKLITKKNEYNLDKDILVMGILNLTPDSFSDGGNINPLTKQ